jgi:hypothetical protein
MAFNIMQSLYRRLKLPPRPTFQPEPTPAPVVEAEPVLEVEPVSTAPIRELIKSVGTDEVVVETFKSAEPVATVEEDEKTDPSLDLDWHAGQKKAELLAVAQAKGLAVTDDNTKAEIVSALKASE